MLCYSLPSSLKSRRVRVRIYEWRIEVWYANKLIETLPRLTGLNRYHINYRHLIGSLLRKPGGFRNYRHRDDLLSQTPFRLAWEALNEHFPPRKADLAYLRILKFAADGQELIQHGRSVLFSPTFRLVDDLPRAKRDLLLEQQLRKLDRFEVLILDDIGYVQQSREEMEVLFTLLAERYERRSVVITSNLVFSQWDQIFKDPMTTAAAIDRVVHHSIIVEFGKEVPSHRAEEAARRINDVPNPQEA